MSASDRTLTSVGEAYVKDILVFLPEAGVLLGGCWVGESTCPGYMVSHWDLLEPKAVTARHAKLRVFASPPVLLVGLFRVYGLGCMVWGHSSPF